MNRLSRLNRGKGNRPKSFWEDVLDALETDMDMLDLASRFSTSVPDLLAKGNCIAEDDKEITLEISAPGLNKEDITVILDETALSIKAESSKEFKSAFVPPRIDRKYTVLCGATEEDISVCYEDGIIIVSIAKKPTKETKKIAVK